MNAPASGVPIGIVGGTGGIGRWFADFFAGLGHPVLISGRNSGPSADEMAKAAPVVIVSVPIRATEGVIRAIGPRMPRESLLMDFTSLKSAPLRVMLESSRCEVIGLHPLFGPSAPSLEGQNIAVCPGRGERWRPWVWDTFTRAGARLVETDPARHDEIMSVVQVLNHLNSLVLACAVRDSGIPRRDLEALSTPLFRSRLAGIDALLSRPELHAEILAGNPHTGAMIDRCERHLRRIRSRLEAGDVAGLAACITAEP